MLLGYYDPEFFLGGDMTLDTAAARDAYERLGRKLDMDAVHAAWGVHQVVCENMARAARVHIIEKGRDPRAFPMLAFGGAGPAHAARVARILGAREVLVPPISGVAAALGFLVAPTSFEFVRSFPGVLDALAWDAIQGIFETFEREARTLLNTAGVENSAIMYERSADARLVGQFHEIEIPVPAGPLSHEAVDPLKETFAEIYGARYHTVIEGYRPMAMNWRLRAFGPEPEVALSAESRSDGERTKKGTRHAYFPEADGFVETPVYDRYALPAGVQVHGPAIIEERESTTVIAPGDSLVVDEDGNLRIAIAVTTSSSMPVEVEL